MVKMRLLLWVALAISLCIGVSEGAKLLSLTGAAVVPDEYIVSLKSRTGLHGTSSVLRDVEAIPGAKVLREYKLGDRIFIRLSIRVDQVKRLLTNPHIEMIGPNEMLKNDAVVESFEKAPRVAMHNTQTIRGSLPHEPDCHLDYGGPDAWGIIRTSWRALPTDWENTPYVWGDADSGEGVDAYVVDTGIRITHEDFEGRAYYGMTGEWSYSSNPELGEQDINGHGTHIAGTIGGKRYGLARKANLWAVKVLDHEAQGPWSDTIEGLEWIINRINRLKSEGKVPRSVLNMSLSAYGSNPLLEIAAQATMDAGVVFCNSAGNVANDTCLRSPAKMGSSLTVAATNLNDTLASFSNYGPCTAIMAPGRNIMSASANTDSAYRVMSGTSMSTPHVVGVAAKYLSQLSEEEAARTSHERVKAVLSDMATRDVIRHNDLARVATPDYNLYKTCVNRRYQELETTTTLKYVAGTTTTLATTPSSTPSTTIESPQFAQSEAWGNEDIGPVSVAMMAVAAIVVGTSFGLMGFTHAYVAMK